MNEIPGPFDRAVLIKGVFLELLCAFYDIFFYRMFPLSLYKVSLEMFSEI